jgi:hypothetical protein
VKNRTKNNNQKHNCHLSLGEWKCQMGVYIRGRYLEEFLMGRVKKSMQMDKHIKAAFMKVLNMVQAPTPTMTRLCTRATFHTGKLTEMEKLGGKMVISIVENFLIILLMVKDNISMQRIT